MKYFFLPLALVVSCSASAANITEDSRKFIEREVSQYMQNGTNGFMEVISKDGPTMSDKAAQDIIVGMVQIEASCGKPTGYSIKKITELSENTSDALFIINLEKCPLFVRQVIYRTKSGRVMSPSFGFHNQPQAVWPSGIF